MWAAFCPGHRGVGAMACLAEQIRFHTELPPSRVMSASRAALELERKQVGSDSRSAPDVHLGTQALEPKRLPWRPRENLNL